MSDRKKALIYFNIYLILKQAYSMLIKYLIRPGGGLMQVKPYYNGVDPFEMSFFRTIFNFTFTFLLTKLWYKRNFTDIPKDLYPSLFIRSFFGMTSFVTLTFSTAYLPLSISVTIANTSSFFILILSYFLLREKLRFREFLCMVLGFCGMAILLHTKINGDKKYQSFD